MRDLQSLCLLANYSAFLFDFDGLLVDTEKLHFQAYQEMCRRHGGILTWDLNRYFQEAHFSEKGLRDALYREFPHFRQQGLLWEALYAEKSALYKELLRSGDVELMPGVRQLLQLLEKKGVKRAVVTNSKLPDVQSTQSKLPILQTIPLWITRECYERAKPHPDGYLLALKELGVSAEKAIGFEDSFRGLMALKQAGIASVVIAPLNHPILSNSEMKGVQHFLSIEHLMQE